MDREIIEIEIARRIKANEGMRGPGCSKDSKAKFGARNAELSDLLGWIRKYL